MATTAEINTILIDTALAYPAYDKARLTQSMKHYVKALSGYGVETIKTAAEQVITESKWFPAVAEIIAVCRKVEANNEPKGHTFAPDILHREMIGLERVRTFGRFIPAEWERLAKKLGDDKRIFLANYIRQKAGLPTVDYHFDETAMIAHDREYEAAHPFTGERWWEIAHG